MKWLIILMLLVMPIVLAEGDIEEYTPNQVIPLPIYLTSITGSVTGASCNTQIKNNSYDVIVNIAMNEIGNGWYNATYNTSRTGYYYCSQNCTYNGQFTGGECDFIVMGDTAMIWAIIFTIFAIIALYLYLTKNIDFSLFTEEAWTKHKGISFMFTMMTYWLMLIPLGIVTSYNTDYIGSTTIGDYLTTLYIVMATMNTFFTVYFFAWLIVGMAKMYKLRQMSKGGYK